LGLNKHKGENMKKSDVFFNDLQAYRTPSQMKTYFESKYEEIISDQDYNKLARLKTGMYKNFLEEFYPLLCFSQSKYVPLDSEIRVVIGNQGYDGVIKFANSELKKIEVTEYIDGKTEHEDALLINQRGYSKIRISDTKDLGLKAEIYMDGIVANAYKKAIKNYEGVTLIIVVNTFIHLDIWNLDTKCFIEKTINRLREIPFNTDEVYLLVRNSDPIEMIDQNLYKVK
jgi:hypothetical protein